MAAGDTGSKRTYQFVNLSGAFVYSCGKPETDVLVRSCLFAVCLAASWLTVMVSHAETALTGSAAGPLCRIAAMCAASSLRIDAGWGGDDDLTQFLYESPHLQDCVRQATCTPGLAIHQDMAMLAHILFEC